MDEVNSCGSSSLHECLLSLTGKQHLEQTHSFPQIRAEGGLCLTFQLHSLAGERWTHGASESPLLHHVPGHRIQKTLGLRGGQRLALCKGGGVDVA